jgi:uncharacterized protein with PQ loop repeat
MRPHPAAQTHLASDGTMKWLVGAMSVFTLAMTLPQVLIIWLGRQAAGVSIWSWSAYWVSAAVWLVYGLRKRDPNIYLPCIGWLLLDGAVIAGVVMYG